MNIMFICTGNTCRSAMAHQLMEKKTKDAKINDVQIYSCGIYAQDGELATSNAIDIMEQYDVDLKKHKATNIKNSKIENMDLILCATLSHKQIIINMYPNMKDKIYTIKEYAKISKDGQDVDIRDPWGYNNETYKKCAEEINECLNNIISILNKANT